MSNLEDITLNQFFSYYRSDIETEVIDDNNVVLSFPIHFSGFHRIEVTVTQLPDKCFIISDGGKILDELRTAGYILDKKLRMRLEHIVKVARIRIVNSYIVANCCLADLGESLQRFLEAAKTIGDAYLVQRTSTKRDAALISRVSSFLAEQRVPFQTKHALNGKYERHVVDFYFPPNGVPGLALSVMNNPTRTMAEAWAFRSLDIKKTNQRTQVGVVYEDEEVNDNSRSILNGVLDISIPSSDISALQKSLQVIGILKASSTKSVA